MSRQNSISALIITKNEAKRLPNCFKSLDWIKEIVIIDDYSTDDTLKIAKKFGAKVYQRQLGNFASQRNFGLTKIKTDWVFLIDVDEEPTPELKEEILSSINQKENDGYYFPRKNIIFGKWIKHTGWYPDFQLHLFKAQKGKYVGQVHEQVKINGKVGYLKHHLLHHNYQTVSQYLKKLDQYTMLAAEMKIKSGYQFGLKDVIREPAGEFLKRFFAEKGYQDGLHGLILSLLQSFSALIVYVKIWEAQGFKAQEFPLSDFFPEMKKLTKETAYWLRTALIDEQKKPLQKTFLKLKRRLSR